MLHLTNPDFASSDGLTEYLGMSNSEYELWKEEVQMEAIRYPRHAEHWVSDRTNEKT